MCGSIFVFVYIVWNSVLWGCYSKASLAVRPQLGTCCKFVPYGILTGRSLSSLDRQAILVHTHSTVKTCSTPNLFQSPVANSWACSCFQPLLPLKRGIFSRTDLEKWCTFCCGHCILFLLNFLFLNSYFVFMPFLSQCFIFISYII